MLQIPEKDTLKQLIREQFFWMKLVICHWRPGQVLRVLESGEFMRVGDSVTKKTDVRVIAATNKDLAKLVQEGKLGKICIID